MKNYIIALLISYLFVSLTAFGQEGLSVGTETPVFEANNQFGEVVSSINLLEEHSGLIIVFYRGSWCPYCTKHLSYLQDSLKYITQLGYELVVISPEQTSYSKDVLDEQKTSYPILHDEDYSIMKSFDVYFTISEETVPRAYNYVEKKTAKSNGNDEGVLPVPATYVVNKGGEITWRHFDKDYRKRSSVSAILQAIE